jgi:hypothetical protein
MILTDSTSNYLSIIKSDEFINICRSLNSPCKIPERYDRCIQLMNKIIGEIDMGLQ